MANIKKVTDFEKEFLMELVNKYKDIVENKDFKLTEQKSIVWEKITREFNEELVCSKKSSAQLRKCWANMKARAKKSCLESITRFADNGQPPECLRREYAKIMQMLPQHFADITDSIENEEILAQMIAESQTAATVVPDAIQEVSHPERELLLVTKTEHEEEEDEDEMLTESLAGTSNALTCDPLVASTVGATHQSRPTKHDEHLNKDCKQNRSELDERTLEMEIRLLEDKIRFQAEEHSKKMDLFNYQISHAEQEHQMRMLYLKLKLDKLNNLQK